MASSLTSLPVVGALGEAAARSECSDEEEPKPGSAVRDKTLPAATAITVKVPAFSGEFASWEELETAFERYQEEIQKSYKLRTSNTARDRNRDQRRRTALAGKEQVLLDERLEFYTNTFICEWQRTTRSVVLNALRG
ncbi:hypothetical protein PC128_g24307 [Phytophthora cactorum]|nr:hypothetical protein PC128_g24307 [Phytophthora cactorum]